VDLGSNDPNQTTYNMNVLAEAKELQDYIIQGIIDKWWLWLLLLALVVGKVLLNLKKK